MPSGAVPGWDAGTAAMSVRRSEAQRANGAGTGPQTASNLGAIWGAAPAPGEAPAAPVEGATSAATLNARTVARRARRRGELAV
jgi:hypothetical protein